LSHFPAAAAAAAATQRVKILETILFTDFDGEEK